MAPSSFRHSVPAVPKNCSTKSKTSSIARRYCLPSLARASGSAVRAVHRLATTAHHLDSPLASRFTQAYRELNDFWNDKAEQRHSKGRKPTRFRQLITFDSHVQHQKTVNYLASTGRPAIVIAGNGICSGGRITTSRPCSATRSIKCYSWAIRLRALRVLTFRPARASKALR
ncbi:hypothetical protein [Pseudomonas putida]|uniref:hypothetical protein n=1 Tax=Pseudomonas putida TaxID=303 RepID=UPI002A913A67|nr:hypothetical protein [Pseudomonas putida]